LPKELESPGSEQNRQLLLRGTHALGIALSQGQVDNFIAYIDLIQSWNAKFNLTAIRSTSLIVRHHFIDSLAIAPFTNPDKRLMDIGSGAGFPGIPLKIIFPDKEITLVDSQRKKINFMREVVRDLDLKGVEVIEARVEELNPAQNGLFGETVARAFGSLDQFLRISSGLLAPGGQGLFMSGPKGPTAYTYIKDRCIERGFIKSRIESYRLPIGDEQRTLLIFSKN
jgi:16S rRNA (guanine527-N7)-methyltransferase